MSEARGQVWLRDHWMLACFGFAGAFLLLSALVTPNLLRVRNAAHLSALPTYNGEVTTDFEGVRSVNTQLKVAPAGGMAYFAAPYVPAVPNLPDRKIARTSTMELLVTHPSDEAEKIRAYAESVGGYVERSEVSGIEDAAVASLTLQVPSVRLEEVKGELRKRSVRVQSEKSEAQDVTREYVDVQARLRNLRAEEAQYLQIMHSASKVQDMLDVSQKLSEVRGQIEQTQAEFEALSKQVEMVSISLSLRAQPAPEGLALNWQPMRQLKVSLQDGLDGLADYATAMTAALLYLPVILLWIATLVLGTAAGWRGLRWTARKFFKIPQAVESAAPAH